MPGCEKCGKLLADNAAFCPFCGVKVSKKEEKKGRTGLPLYVIMIIASVVVIALIVITLATRNSLRKDISREVSREPELKIYHPTIQVQDPPPVRAAEQNSIKRTPEYLTVYDTYRDKNDPYLNLRSGPAPTYGILKKLRDGDIVEIRQKGLGKDGKWFKVFYGPSGTEGYVNSRYLKKTN